MLVNCGVYEQGTALSEGHSIQELGSLGQDKPGRFAWAAFKEGTPEELRLAQEAFGLPPLAVEDALRGGQMPKIEEYAGSIFLSLRQFEIGADGKLEDGELDIFLSQHSVVSSRLGAGGGFSSVRERAAREPELLSLGPAYVLYAIMDLCVDRYFPVAQAFETRLEALEARIFADSGSAAGERKAIARELYALKGELSRFKHGIDPAIELCIKLFGGRVPTLCAGLHDYFRDVHDHLIRIGAHVDRMREALVAAASANLALVTIDESVTTKKLAAWAAIFAAPTLLAGVWGMNFKAMPELQWQWGYPLSILSMLAVSVAMWWKFKRIGWL